MLLSYWPTSTVASKQRPPESLRTLRNKRNCAFGFSTTLMTQAATGIVTYFGLLAYFDRPRGKLIDDSLIEAKQSQVDGAGLGLYAAKALPEGTILGTYPGVLRPTGKYLAQYEGDPNAGVYAWRFSDNEQFIDPTDREGKLQELCYGGTSDFPFSYFLHENIFKWKVPTLLARINEPPIGWSGCNVCTAEDRKTREVIFSLSRDVEEGEELFMDYGLSYDRSDYSKI